MSTSVDNPKNSQSSKDTPKNSSLVLKDWIAFCFSIAAIIISVVNFYFSNIRVDENLQARAIEIDEISEHSESGKEIKYIVLRMAFLNTGNRQALILRASYTMTGRPDPKKAIAGIGNDFDTAQTIFPILIEPHNIRLVDLRIPVQGLVNNLAMGEIIMKPSWNTPGRTAQFHCSLEFFSLDSHGQYYDVNSDPVAIIDVHEKGMTAGNLIDEKKYKPISLFEK